MFGCRYTGHIRTSRYVEDYAGDDFISLYPDYGSLTSSVEFWVYLLGIGITDNTKKTNILKSKHCWARNISLPLRRRILFEVILLAFYFVFCFRRSIIFASKQPSYNFSFIGHQFTLLWGSEQNRPTVCRSTAGWATVTRWSPNNERQSAADRSDNDRATAGWLLSFDATTGHRWCIFLMRLLHVAQSAFIAWPT